MSSPPGSQAAGSQAALEAIMARGRQRVLARVALLEEAVAALLEDRLSEEQRREAEREAHRVAGAAGTFGFPRASDAARQLEWVLAGSEALSSDSLLRAADEVVALRAGLEGDPVPSDDLPVSVGEGSGRRAAARGLVVAVSEEQVRDRIVAAARRRGFVVTVAQSSADLPAPGDPPVAALVDLGLPGQAGARLIARLNEGQTPAVVLALTPPDQFCDRVEATRHGARSFLGLGTAPEEMLNAVEDLLRRTRVADTTVLVVDDDIAVLDTVVGFLDAAGLRGVPLHDPQRFWATLEQERPDMVILDLDMPSVRGDELCRVVRGDPTWAGLPILFLTGHTDPDAVEAIFAAGADDFVAKPFGGPELLARVRNRLERTRLLQALAEKDPLTGLVNRRHSELELQRLLTLAERHRQPFAVAMIDLDQFKHVNDDHGHAVGDTVLRRVGSLLRGSFRGEDVVARWGGEEFLLGMYGMNRDDGVQQVASALEILREERFVTPSGRPLTVTFSAGVATFPDDATSLSGLREAADQALYRAKRRGGNRVLPAAPPDLRHDVDVVIVEDDPVLAELLGHALTTRGYRFEHLADGRSAVEQLTGETPRLDARVVLLDVDLPSLNGFGVLRAMAASGTLGGTRVIMLTARSGEQDVVEALELGAFDHVAKPFSVPILLQRIRRALGS